MPIKNNSGTHCQTKIEQTHLCDLTDEALERQLADKQFGRLLILANLPKSYCPRPVAWLLA